MINIKNIILKDLSFDISTVCQLHCPECSTSKGINRKGIIGHGMATFDLFKSVIDNNPSIKHLELSNWGEIFLNESLDEMLEYAFRKNVKLSCGSGSNFNNVSFKTIENLVKYQFHYINLSIDGGTQETYQIYRKGGNFHKVMENIKLLNDYKMKYESEYPKVSWQFIIFGHNEHEIPDVKRMCNDLSVKFNPRLNYSDFSPVVNKEFVRRESGLSVANRTEFLKKYGKLYKSPCYQCFSSPQINWDGKILGCCVNKWRDVGNIRDGNIRQQMISGEFNVMLRVLLKEVDADDSIPCYHCPNYLKNPPDGLTLEGLAIYNDFIHPAL